MSKAIFMAKNLKEGEHLMTDQRSKDALNAAERFANGEATQEELLAAESAARSAVESAVESAAESAWSAVQSAARSAQSAARSAQSAWSAAWSAAWSVESAAQSAAWSSQEKELRRVCAQIEESEK